MTLQDYILDEKNIYLAIYAVKSYIFEPQLLDRKDKELLNKLVDPFNEDEIEETIKEVQKILSSILEDKDYLFETQVYYKPKDYKDNKAIYRPIHTASLVQLIAMVALLHPLIYEIPSENNNWKLNLSNYSHLIPNNFYGNRVSKKPEELFKKWNRQYKKYTQKVNDYFKTFHESKEYKYELKLDLKNFFPSVHPLVIYGILIENIPVTLNEEDIEILKKVIYKLLVCEISNLNTDLAKEEYYGISGVTINYTRGIAQGLPQSYFFGNICMIKISEIFEKKYEGKSVYYVDDSYIYTNTFIKDDNDFINQINDINKKIEEMASQYIEIGNNDKIIRDKEKYLKYNQMLEKENKKEKVYHISVYDREKSVYTIIPKASEGEVCLKTLSREASQIGADIHSTYSEEEEETILHRTEALLKSIEVERKNNTEDSRGYKEKLDRYYKFFKYRELKLRLKMEKNLSKKLFEVLVGKIDEEIIDGENHKGYKYLEKGIETKTFFDNYKNDIWQVALSLLITNTVYEQEQIREYIKRIIHLAYNDQLIECSYIKKMYNDYLNHMEVRNIPDYYATLNFRTNKRMVHFANLNSKALKKEFSCVKLKGLKEDILSSYEICSKDFIEMCKIVNLNSDRLQRMVLNAIYSKIFRVTLSEDIVINSYDKKGITYGELRVLVFLRNPNCKVLDFLRWEMELMSADNLQNVDYTIFEVLGAYERYVSLPKNMDDLIMIHKYTCDIWKNGAKHLYFYTLHNQEHAVDLVKNIIKIVKTFSYLKITHYDYYVLFIACYLHDISMVKIASRDDFLLDSGNSDIIVTKVEEEWNKCHNTGEIKKVIIEIYNEVDDFFENKIRSKHAQESAKEIRCRKDLDFLETSVREIVAEIAESHMMDVENIYYLKGDAREKLVSYKFDKILLRFADLLDMSKYRVSKPILNHNIDNMSSVSAFHWISHLLTEGYELTSSYECGSKGLLSGNIIEKVTLTIFVNLSQFSKLEARGCNSGKLIEQTLQNDGFEIKLLGNNGECKSTKCNFLCRWFNKKNNYLVQEMQALEGYLSRIPLKDKFYKTKIIIKVVVSNPTDIKNDQFDILKNAIDN